MVRGRPAFRAVGFSKPEAGERKSYEGSRDTPLQENADPDGAVAPEASDDTEVVPPGGTCSVRSVDFLMRLAFVFSQRT